MADIAYISLRKMGGYDVIDIHQWQAIPEAQRQQIIAQGDVEFVDEEGEMVPVAEALAYFSVLKEEAL